MSLCISSVHISGILFHYYINCKYNLKYLSFEVNYMCTYNTIMEYAIQLLFFLKRLYILGLATCYHQALLEFHLCGTNSAWLALCPIDAMLTP